MSICAKMNHRIVRFVLVGILNTLVGYGLFAFFIFIHLHYSVATLLATVVGVAFNFISTSTVVFKKLHQGYLPRFILVYSLLYGLNVVFLKLLLMYGLTAYIAGLVLLPIMAGLSYLLQSRLVFNQPVKR